MPVGLITPADWVAMAARRYMHKYGATCEDFGRVAVAARAHAATNPTAWFYQRPITLEDHQNSRMIADPVRLLDCCQESDGGVALVVVSAERARDLPANQVLIAGAAQGSAHDQHMMTSYYRDDITGLPEMGTVARQLWSQSGLGPDDVQTAIIYDHFTPFVLTSSRSSASAGAARPRTSSATVPSTSADGCRSTPTAVSSARPTSTA